MKRNSTPKLQNYNILITGASSGIGEALAMKCAEYGAKNLFLCGRNAERLAAVAQRCASTGTVPQPTGTVPMSVETKVLDVTDRDAMEAWIRDCDKKAPLNIVFSNAGIATGNETDENVRNTFETNVFGNLNTVLPTIEAFRSRSNDGTDKHIVMTASIAGYHGMPTCPSYSGSKAAIKAWGSGLRGMLEKEGIKVSVVCPGFVRSRITDKNTCPMPFFLEAPDAAEIIISRVLKNIGLIAFPWQMRFSTWLLSILPDFFSERIYRMMPQKISTR